MGRSKDLFQQERLRQFWNEGLHPITGYEYYRYQQNIEEDEKKYFQQRQSLTPKNY
jgi:hypothetical protein